VLPDPKKAGRILVWDSICPNSHYNEGGSVFVTEDGGWSWKRMKLPKPLREWVVDQPLDVGAQISELKMINGDFNRLEIRWNNKGWYRTADGGKTWKAIKASAKGAKAVRSPNKTLVSTLAIFHHHFQAA
jgi:photosystem II stability/assembly factor-like uncharacterized protein